ncbi:MAG: gamma-glutamyltransferase [Chloroflexota bacterium]
MGGVISAGGPETAVAGAEMFKLGGNAVDAAVAAAFASFMGEIGVVHLGGSGLAHIYSAQNGRSQVYDFFSNTPGLGGTSPERLNFDKVTIDFGATTQDFYIGRASVAVPGNLFGLCQLLSDHGRLPLKTVLQPAIELAKDGLPITPFQARTCQLLEPLYTYTPAMREIFYKNERMIEPHEKLFIPDLAETLEALAEEGEALIRNGRLAQQIVADQQAHQGLLTAQDLAAYQVHQSDSIRIPYHEYEILLPGQSSTGGVLTAFTLKLLSGLDVAQYEHGSTKHLQLLYESMVATNRARRAWNAALEEMPIEEATERFLAERFVNPHLKQVHTSLELGKASPYVTEPNAPENTSHLSVIDSEGLAVSLTTTAGESAGYVVPNTGFIPNNMMGEIDLHPKGFHSRPAGERITTMMTPVVVLQDGQPRMVLGSGGSIRIRSAIMQVLSNLLDFKMDLETAVNTARVHVESGALQCEAGFDPIAVYDLSRMDYPINRWSERSIYFGGVHTVTRTPDGTLHAAGDNRRGGSTATVK